MSTKKRDAEMLRALTSAIPQGAETEALERVASQLEYEAKKDDDWTKLQEIGKNCAECLAEMVAALQCDYDRMEELRDARNDHDSEQGTKGGLMWADAYTDDATELAELEEAAGECESEEDARQRIEEDPLCIDLGGTWTTGETPVPERAYILLGTGGPATRIVCELDSDLQPSRAWIEAQDWFQPWTEYRGDAIDQDALLAYCACLYYGEV